MKFESFESGSYKQQYKYKSFYPNKINQNWSWDDPQLNVLIEEAVRKLGELNAYSLIVPNVDLFIKMHKNLVKLLNVQVNKVHIGICMICFLKIKTAHFFSLSPQSAQRTRRI